MPVLSAHFVSLKHILSPATIYADIDTSHQANGATIYVLNFDTSCHRRQNMPSTLKQIVAKNSTDLEKKYLNTALQCWRIISKLEEVSTLHKAFPLMELDLMLYLSGKRPDGVNTVAKHVSRPNK